MDPTTPAEHALLAAARAGTDCDLRTDTERTDLAWAPTAADAAHWGDDRVVRAAFLRYLLLDDQLPVSLAGARIDGTLDVRGDHTLSLSLPRCVLTGTAEFFGATFTGNARFDGATFTGDAGFGEATFTGNARFGEATFTGNARFGEATFTGNAEFFEATFTGNARFGKARFTRDAWFGEATFTGNARFGEATFTRDAVFREATFTRDARFGKATFTRDAVFREATFTRNALFDEARFRKLDWSHTRWSATQSSTAGVAAERIVLDDAVFETPMRVDVTAGSVSAKRVRATERLHLVVAAATVDLTDADLAEGSLIEAAPVAVPDVPDGRRAGPVPGGGTWAPIPATEDADGTSRCPAGMPMQVWLELVEALMRLDRTLTTALGPGRRAAVTSLQRAHVAGVTLSGMDLRDCTFAGVDGLDELVIAGDNVLASNRAPHDTSTRSPVRGVRWWRTDRRVIRDELALRHRTPPPPVGNDPPGGR